jgi:sugar lactone lactonase YvrE
MTWIARIARLMLVLLPFTAAAQPATYPLEGERVFPEGIALSRDGGSFFVGSTTTGTIYRGDIASGEVEVFAEGAAPVAIGLEADPHGRLWVAGGMTGQVFVYDTATGELVRSYETPTTEATFLNDLVYVDGAVYVTDSRRPELFRIGAGETLGELESFVSFEGSAMPYGPPFAFAANGIVATPDGSALVIVHSGNGALYRVDLATREVTDVENRAAPMIGGDGMVLDGDTLYVVRNAIGQIDRLTLSAAGDAVVPAGDPLRSDLFQFPTTAVVAEGHLLVVNAQFDRQGEGPGPVLPFNVARVAIP